MNLKQFVAELALAGVKLWVEGDQLRVRAPKEVLTPEVRNLLALHKAELVKLLQKKSNVSDTSIPQVPVTLRRNFPLSFAQEGLWFLSQLEPTNPFYNEVLALRLHGSLNVVALEKSLNKIIQRHEVLRTNFATVEGQLFQVIAESLTLSVQVLDLGELPESDREIAWGLKATAQVQQPFELSSSGLIQASVLKLTQTEHILLLTIHHIVWDAPSEGVLVKELAALYTAYCNDLSLELPELPIQYADFAVWQRQRLQGDVLESQLAYWKQKLESAPALLELPTDRVRPLTQTFQGACYRQALSKELTEALMILSQRQGVTLFMTLLAAFQTLLYRYTGQTDICVGTPYAGRERPEIESLIGLFVNTLVLRTDISGNPSFEELLLRVRQVALGAYAHTDLPFEKLVEQLQPARNLSYRPLCQVMLQLYSPLPQIDMEGLTVSQVAVERATAKFDLSLAFFNTDKGLIGDWEYNTDLFDASTIARMASHFKTLLAGIVANPQQKVSSLPLLTIQERHQLLVEWNHTTKEYPQDKCIHQLFEEQVELTPDKVAVVFEDKQLTYRELNQRANCLAHYLKTLGVRPEVLVGICVERSPLMVVSLLGILKAGGAYLPLDPALPKESLAFRLQDAQVSILLTHHGLFKREDAQVQRVLYLDADWELIAQESDANPLSEITPENLAYVLYTSGSTGQPKGVAIEQRQILSYLHAILDKLQLPTGASFATVSTFAADLGNTAIFPALCTGGGCLHIVSQELSTDPKALAEYFQRHPIDCLKITPAHLASLLASNASDSIVPRQCLVLGGEAASWDLIDKIQQHAPNCRILNHYGPTETTVGVLTYPVSSKQASYNSKTVPIGRPIANTQVYILDHHLQPVPIGVPGELHIGGASLARGYLNRPDLTDEKFIHIPFGDQLGDRLYKTGDQARYLRDGNIEFLGRIDNQVKVRGFRIELGEIEAVLTAHPEVREAVVIDCEDIPGNKRLVAYVVVCSHSSIKNQLRDFLKQKLPDYMVPSAFVILDVLPLTPNGKVDRRALPAPSFRSDSDSFVLPRTSNEEILAAIWKDVLRLELVGIHDNFFELGGDSIISLLIIARANQMGLQFTTKQLFQHQTIADLATVASTTSSIKADQGLVTGVVPLTPIQRRFFDQNWSEPNHFNQSTLLVVPPDMKPALLEQVVKELIVHHDALRMRFELDESGWQQRNTDICELDPLLVIDLSAVPVEEQKAAIERIVAKLQTTLNLVEGPLLRLVLFSLGHDCPSRLLLIIHHLVVDGVSWRILLEDIATAYQQLEQDSRIQLPPKTTSFKDWAIKQKEYGLSPALEQELDYWLAQSSSDTTPIPVDYPDGIEVNTEGSIAEIPVFLNEEETRTLLQEVPSVYNTQINDVLLTALVQTFAQWTGDRSVLIGLEGHGREELFDDVDLSRTVGWFTTVFPVFFQLGETDEPGVALKLIKEQLRRIPNRGIGYGIQRYLSQDTDICKQLQALPKPEVRFNYLGQFNFVQPQTVRQRFTSQTLGWSVSPKAKRSYLLEVIGLVVEGKLQMIWYYSENIYRRETVESLANKYNSALKALIAHCQSPSAGGYTPTDFPLADLGQQELDDLLSEID